MEVEVAEPEGVWSRLELDTDRLEDDCRAELASVPGAASERAVGLGATDAVSSGGGAGGVDVGTAAVDEVAAGPRSVVVAPAGVPTDSVAAEMADSSAESEAGGLGAVGGTEVMPFRSCLAELCFTKEASSKNARWLKLSSKKSTAHPKRWQLAS